MSRLTVPNVPRDGNMVPVLSSNYPFVTVCAPSAFTGGTPSTRGAFATTPTTTLFTVTGIIVAKIFATCTVTLVGATATVEVGVAGQTAGLIAQTTATNIVANEVWVDATPDTFVEPTSSLTERIVTQNIIETVGTANITAGNLRYVLIWYPLSASANVVASTPE